MWRFGQPNKDMSLTFLRVTPLANGGERRTMRPAGNPRR
jgi:hypothetical protein